jgi:hypothetical protein
VSQYRIRWQILKRRPNQGDFEEIGDGNSGIAETLEEAADGAVALLRSLTNEQGEKADLPSA